MLHLELPPVVPEFGQSNVMNVDPGIIKTETRVVSLKHGLNPSIAKAFDQIRHKTRTEGIAGIAKRITLERANTSLDQTWEISSSSHLRPQGANAGILRTTT